ncbi:long-chain fatty acid--CoA ligase [Roseovarius salis]|uniref:long-chain fatty acid--CoA ligase n=1 Tax=Roseovarius salis TaxID=3376063 RepID=UPI0037C85499
MQGMMMHRDLRIIDILTFAAEAFPDQGIISARDEGDLHRLSYPQVLGRVAQLAHALRGLGIGEGDRVATLAWNGHRHFELYYGVSGIGAVCHTVNPRLPAEQMSYILNHAGDSVLFVDLSLIGLVEALRGDMPSGIRIVVMTDRAHMPDTDLDVLCYEELLGGQPTSMAWPEFPETTAAGLCYTSGTTGHPKGALYSHRSTVLHALYVVAGHPQSLSAGRRALPVVPLFHVNAWGMPYTAPLAGMTMVMPGRHLDGASLYDLMEAEEVYTAWGVPTVWAGLQAEIEKRGRPPRGFADLVVGGAAAPRAMIAAFEGMGINVNQAWGMTEMSPIGTRGVLPAWLKDAPKDEQIDAKTGAGRRLFGVEFKIVDDAGRRLPHDGDATGELYVRGNTVISAYYENEGATQAAFDAEGWFGTGDVSTVGEDGRLIIRDRAKDLVKSGGEWISSIDLENHATAHPGIKACAVIAVPHPKWDERPVLVAVPAGDSRPALDDIHAHMSGHFAKWQLPDDIVFVDELPLTATGKVSKLTLRKQFEGYVLPEFREGGA